MQTAIGITVSKAAEGHDLGDSKFFGTPTVPAAWLETLGDELLFVCQIKCSDFAALDSENRLPHTGYLYFFLDISTYPYQPCVRYYDGEPDLAIDDFNEDIARFSHLTQEWVMHFHTVASDEDGIKLLGVPVDWQYQEPAPPLLLQFDPLCSEMGFLDEMDGFLYFFFGNPPTDWDAVTLRIERS